MNSQCSIALLESALAGNLSQEDETSLHRHLEECDECGAVLERMAGGPAWCQEAAALLTGDELDKAVPIRDDWSAVDFTVEHLEPADEPNVLGRLGGYDVLEIIGHGGMGVVLKAFDRELKRCVAIKVLAPYLAQSSLAKKRFAREAQAAAAIVHPHVLAIHQVQPAGRLPFLVMPLLAGESLAERLTAQGTLELKEVLRIGMQAAAGLAAAHEQGLVHRDVKPANILLEKGVERAVLTDFGLARAADDVTLTRWGIIAGTPQYMSPEQAQGEPLDGRSDLFSLGCVLYEMSTGVSPFRSDSMMATMRRLVDDSPKAMASLNPELPPWFIAIVERLLEKDPSRRFGSAKEVSELLEGCLAHVQQPGSVPLPAALADGARRRARRPFTIRFKGVLAMIAALGAALLGVFLLSADPPDIAGEWSGEEWGHVVLNKTNDAQYTGTYSDTFGQQPGEIELEWSRFERRFNGTWREGEDRFGEISVRLVGDEIRGAHTTDPKSKINPAPPRLADLLWTRAKWILPGDARANSDSTSATQLPESQPTSADALTEDVEWKKLQGSWVAAKGGSYKGEESSEAEIKQGGHRLVIEGDKLSWYTALSAEPILKGTIKLDPAKKPKALDLSFTRDAKEAVGKCIYELEGDTLKLCYDEGERPTEFKTRADAPNLKLYVFTVANGLQIKGKSAKSSPSPPRLMFRVHAKERVAVLAYSPDGKRIAIANGNPTFPLAEDWKRSVEILDAETGKTVVPLQFTTDEEVAVLTATEGLPHFGVEALAFSPEGNVLAVGTGMGQMKLFNARTGELVRSLDDEQAKLAETKTPETLRSISRAMGSVTSLAFSPDGSLLAMCGGSFEDAALDWSGVEREGFTATGPGRLKIWEIETGTLKQDLVGHSHANAVSFSPDGNLMASAGRWMTNSDWGTGVIIWDAHAGTKVRTMLNEANGGTHAVAFSPNSKFVVIGSRTFAKDSDTSTTNVSLAHALTGNIEWQQTVPGWANPKAFSPDGNSVMVLCDGRGGQSIRFFETQTGTVKYEIRPADSAQGGQWTDFAIALERHSLAIGGAGNEQKGFVERWDFDGLLAATMPIRVHQFRTGEKVKIIACSGDGKLIAIANGNPTFHLPARRKQLVIPEADTDPPARFPLSESTPVEVLDAETGTTVASLQLTGDYEYGVLAKTEGVRHFEVEALAFSPDGNVVAVGTGMGQVKLFKARTGKLVGSLDDQQAKHAEKKTPETLKSLTIAMGSVASLAFSPDGSLLAMCGESFDDAARNWGGVERMGFTATGPGRVKVWDVKTGKLKQDLVGHDRHANAVSFSPDGNLLASAGRWMTNGEWGTGVIIWDPHAGTKIRTITNEANGGTHAVAFSPDSKLVAIGSRIFDKDTDTSTTNVSLVHAVTGIMEWQQTVPGWANPKAFSPDGKSVAVLCGGQSIRFFDTRTGAEKHEIRSPDSPNGGLWTDFAIIRYVHMLAIGGIDAEKRGFVEAWDLDGAPVEGNQ